MLGVQRLIKPLLTARHYVCTECPALVRCDYSFDYSFAAYFLSSSLQRVGKASTRRACSQIVKAIRRGLFATARDISSLLNPENDMIKTCS